MTINFKIMNTTSSDVVLKIDGTVITSQFVYKDSQAEFSLEDKQISNALSITIENSDVIYDITESCKQRINNYVKPIYKVEPELSIPIEDYQSYDDDDDPLNLGDIEFDDHREPHVNGFAADDFFDFRSLDDDCKRNSRHS